MTVTISSSYLGWLHDILVERQSLNFTCPVLDLQLTGDHFCGKTIRCRSANQAKSAFHLFGVYK